MKDHSLLQKFRRKIAWALTLMMVITQSPAADLLGAGVIRVNAFDAWIFYPGGPLETAPEYGMRLSVQSHDDSQITSYQWKIDGEAVSDLASYYIDADDIGKELSVVVSNGEDTAEAVLGTVEKATPAVDIEPEFDGEVMSLNPWIRKNYMNVVEEAADPTGKCSISYCIVEDLENPEENAVDWYTIAEDQDINDPYLWTVPENIIGKYVLFDTVYKGDEKHKETCAKWKVQWSFVPPVIESISNVTVLDNKLIFTIGMNCEEPMEGGNYYCLITPADKGGYDSVSAAYVKKNATQSGEMEGCDFELQTAEITLDCSDLAGGTYVIQLVADSWRHVLSNKIVSNEFTIGDAYGPLDLSASVNTPLTYNGAEQTPSVELKAIGDNAEAVGAWLEEATATGKVSYSFLQTENGYGLGVTGAVKKQAVCDAGVYSIYAASSDPAVKIQNVALGSFRVDRGQAEAPNAAPVLNVTVSEDKTAYIVSVDTSAVTNVDGKTMEYSFNDGKYGSETAYAAGPSENVCVNVRFAETVNTLSGNSVSSDKITTGGRTDKPVIGADTYFTVSQDVVITASVSDDEIYYTTDGTAPSVNNYNASGKGSVVFSISSSTVVKAVAAGRDKLISEVAEAGYTLSNNIIKEESKLATAAFNSRSNRFEFSFKESVSEDTLIKAQIGSYDPDKGLDVIASGSANIRKDGLLALIFYQTDGKKFKAKAGEEVYLRFYIGNELISLDPEYMMIKDFNTYDRITVVSSNNAETYKADFYKYSNSANLIATVSFKNNSIKNDCYYFTDMDMELLDPDALYNCRVSSASGDQFHEYSGFFYSDPLNFANNSTDNQLKSLKISGAGSVTVGEKRQFVAEYTPAEAKLYYTSVSWNSSNPSVATISSDGVVTGLSVGQTTITLSCPGSKAKAVTYVLQVIDKEKSLYAEFVDQGPYVYSNTKITPAVAVYYGGKKLTEGVDYKLSYSNNLNASGKTNAKVKVAGITVAGTVEKEFTIRPRSIDDSAVKVAETIVESGKKAIPVLYLGNYKLTAKDYSFDKDAEFTSNGSMVVIGKGNFKGSRVIDVTVGKPLKFKVSYFKAADRTYNGKDQKLTAKELTVVDATTLAVLKEGTDYILSYQEDIRSAGTKKVSIIGIGKYNTVISKSFKINPLKATGVSVNMPLSEVYHPGKITTDITTIHKTTYLIPNVDYTVKYNKNTKIGKAEVRVTFAGNYKGTQTIIKTFDIVKASISADNVNIYCPDLAWVKDAKYISEPNVTMDGKQISKSDYTVTYTLSGNDISKKKITKDDLGKDNVAVITVTVEGKGNMKGKATTTYRVVYSPKENDLAKAKLTIRDRNGKKVSTLPYTGSEVEFKGDYRLEVVLNGVTLKEGVDYKIEYVNNINKGTAIAIVTGLGETSTEKTKYYGSKSMKFTIKKGTISWY